MGELTHNHTPTFVKHWDIPVLGWHESRMFRKPALTDAMYQPVLAKQLFIMAQKPQTPLTQEAAQAILTKLARNVIDKVGVPIKGIEITNISYADADGVPFKYEQSDDHYAIVNVRAINKHQLALAVEDFKAGRYNEAANRNMSLRVTVADAQLLGKKSFGTLTCQTVALKDEDGNPTGEHAIMPYSFVPAVAEVAEAVDFMSLVATPAPAINTGAPATAAKPTP